MTELTREDAKNHIPDNFYRNPKGASCTMTKRELQETILYTSGTILACGHTWPIRHERIAASIYKVWLDKPDYLEEAP